MQAAHHYIWGLTQELQAAAQARGDVIVQAAFENYTGSTDFDFVVGGWVGWGAQALLSVLRGGRGNCADHTSVGLYRV